MNHILAVHEARDRGITTLKEAAEFQGLTEDAMRPAWDTIAKKAKQKIEDVERLRKVLPNRTDEEIKELYTYYSRTMASAGWLEMNLDAFSAWFAEQQHRFRPV